MVRQIPRTGTSAIYKKEGWRTLPTVIEMVVQNHTPAPPVNGSYLSRLLLQNQTSKGGNQTEKEDAAVTWSHRLDLWWTCLIGSLEYISGLSDTPISGPNRKHLAVFQRRSWLAKALSASPFSGRWLQLVLWLPRDRFPYCQGRGLRLR